VCALPGPWPRVRRERTAGAVLSDLKGRALSTCRYKHVSAVDQQKTSHLSAEQKDCKYSSSSLTKIVICLGGKRVKRFSNTNSDQ
jgi:hypothetical protein